MIWIVNIVLIIVVKNASPSGLYSILKFGEKHCVTHLLFPSFVYVYILAVVMLHCGTNIPSLIAMG